MLETSDDDSRARPALISGSLLVRVLHDKHPGATRLHKLIKDVLQRRHNKELPWPRAWPKLFHAADGGHRPNRFFLQGVGARYDPDGCLQLFAPTAGLIQEAPTPCAPN